MVASSDLTISQLTVEQVRAIFTGEIDNWSSKGDSNTKIMQGPLAVK